MGSLNPLKTPKPAPIVVQEVAPPVVDETPTASSQEDLDKESSKARAESILKRRRGRLGTISTSFRGVLSTNDLSPKRKTLLGE